MASRLSLVLLFLASLAGADEVLDTVNEIRLQGGSPPVALYTPLRELARDNNVAMLAHGKSGHYRGYEYREQYLDSNQISYKFFGEVSLWWVASMSPRDFVQAFSVSPRHWETLLRHRYTHLGYAFTVQGEYAAITIILLEK